MLWLSETFWGREREKKKKEKRKEKEREEKEGENYFPHSDFTLTHCFIDTKTCTMLFFLYGRYGKQTVSSNWVVGTESNE